MTVDRPEASFWIHDIEPFWVKFPDSWPIEGIRWYGVSYFLAFLISAFLIYFYWKKNRSPIPPSEQSSLLTYLIIGTLAGGRIGYVLLYKTHTLFKDPLYLFRIWEGGMASHGGIIGILLAIYFFARKYKHSGLMIGDMMMTIAPIGITLGRIANFINGYLWGKVSYVSWAIIFPNSAPRMPIQLIPPRHPSQLYQASLEGITLLIYVQIRYWLPKERLPSGQVLGEGLIAYSILRCIGEIFREPDAALILGLQRGQFYSVAVAICGLFIVLFARKQKKLAERRKKP